MVAPKGNDFGLKLKSAEIRQEAFKKYCEWLSLGKASRSFTFEKDDCKCVGRTMESYIKDNAEEFPSIHTEFAKCQGYAKWEQIAEDSASGLNKEANTASLQMIMRNKYEWDKKEVVVENEKPTEQMKVVVAGIQNARIDVQSETDSISPAGES